MGIKACYVSGEQDDERMRKDVIKGDTFRRLLLRIGEIRSLLPSHVNISYKTLRFTFLVKYSYKNTQKRYCTYHWNEK